MIEHDWEKTGSVVLKRQANLEGSVFSAQTLAKNPKTFGYKSLLEIWYLYIVPN